MSSREECGLYFRNQPEYGRIFKEMRKKWESLGRTAGRVTLAGGTEGEKKALERFLGRAMEQGQIAFSLSEFEKALGETRYGDVSLKELLEEYFGEPMVGNQERRQQKKTRETEFWDGLEWETGAAEGERQLGEERQPEEEVSGAEKEAEKDVRAEIIGWIHEMREQKSQGYMVVMKEYQKSEESAKERIREIVRCLETCRSLSGREGADGYRWKGVRLAVLAAQATGNPHALDRQAVTGNLLSYVLCRRDGSAFPENARQWKELYEKNGIWVDELSSTVAAFGIHLMTAEGLHPAYEGYWLRREPCIISLANLAHVRSAFGESEKIYIVENEMVFSELAGQLSEYPVTLLCTSGQPRTAVYKLMELLCEGCEGTSFWYAGDMDPEGLDIAQRISSSFPGRVHIWRMSVKDYEKALSQEQVSGRRLEMMKNLVHPVLKRTAEKIRQQKKAGYQEMLLEEMAEDMKQNRRDHDACE